MPNKTPFKPARDFAYFFRDKPGPAALAELQKLGIAFVDCDMGYGTGKWPAFVLPSGLILAISMDDEGNGPGAIHVHEIDDTNPNPA